MQDTPLFVVWARYSRRAATLSAELHGQLTLQYEDRLQARWLKPLSYLVYTWRTWQLLERQRPRTVIVQVPPIFALLVVAAWCAWRGEKVTGHRVPYIIDCHTGTFYDLRWKWSLPLLHWLAKRALVTLVASDEAQKILQHWEVKNLFLIDGIPILDQPTGTVGSEGQVRVAVISGFGLDEPIPELFEAAKLLSYVTFYMSGNPARAGGQAGKILEQRPANVHLTGYLSESAYVGLLKNVHGLVDLTKQPHLLTCGAYEALAVGKPGVISDWPLLKHYFTRGFIYVQNSPQEIAEGITKLIRERATLKEDILDLRQELYTRRKPAFEKLTSLIHTAQSI